MKRLALAFLLLSSPAWGQPENARPEIAVTQDTYDLAVGQAVKLNFQTVFDRIDLTSESVVQAKPLTDKTMTLQGLGEGTAIMTLFVGGRELYSATIIVGAERGHTVRMYDGKSPDYAGFYCTDVACGRRDKELNGAREVSSVTTIGPNGVSRTVTFGK